MTKRILIATHTERIDLNIFLIIIIIFWMNLKDELMKDDTSIECMKNEFCRC